MPAPVKEEGYDAEDASVSTFFFSSFDIFCVVRNFVCVFRIHLNLKKIYPFLEKKNRRNRKTLTLKL